MSNELSKTTITGVEQKPIDGESSNSTPLTQQNLNQINRVENFMVDAVNFAPSLTDLDGINSTNTIIDQ